MAIFLPASAEATALALDEMTPREIVAELDKYVVGQHAAKRAVAIALRNRMRRQKLPPDLAEEIMPKNIIMIGPTGVGKTEIARRLAKLTNSPFLKVEASKFTEVGYVGRDVESMIRDLVENAIDMVREEKLEEVEDKAELSAEDRLLDLLMPPSHVPPATIPAPPASVEAIPPTPDHTAKIIELPVVTVDEDHSTDGAQEKHDRAVARHELNEAQRDTPEANEQKPATSSASSSARASSTTAWSKSTSATATSPPSRSSPPTAPRIWT